MMWLIPTIILANVGRTLIYTNH